MNVSGPAVKKAWLKWSNEDEQRKKFGRLIIVHDELESEIGKVKVKTDAKLSAR